MKNPTILMNPKDLEAFVEQVEAQVHNLKVGKNPMYQGIPISANEYIEEGNLIIYDDSNPLKSANIKTCTTP